MPAGDIALDDGLHPRSGSSGSERGDNRPEGPDARHSRGRHEGHEAAFRDRFWATLALTVPVVFFSEMFQMLLDYEAPAVPGGGWIPAVLGTVIFVYGGTPFLTGAVHEIRTRRPGMMRSSPRAWCSRPMIRAPCWV